MMIKYTSLILMFLLSWNLPGQTTINYGASTDDFANPERGFYRYSETRSSNYTLLDQSTLEGYRLLHTPPTANYSIYSTLVFRYFFLEDFKDSDISQAYLDNMETDFNTARLAGVKLIPRFSYTDEVNTNGCANWICPPYGDASKNWILTHIDQLQPILETHKDVIAVVQMGLIGVWGENYYTDYFGDASLPPDYKLNDNNWTDRIDVLNELLDAVPVERMVQLRYPQKKQRTIYGITAPTSSAALTLSEAFTGTDKARLGFHNDCLLSSADDFGTYTDYGNSSSGSTSDTTNLKPYFADDSQFVAVGGETCDDAYSPQNDCSSVVSSSIGDTELERMHYSYLNAQYNNEVNNDWETNSCMDEIKQRLGYRFELQDGTFSNSAQPGQIFDIELNLINTGYASPFNERGLELMLRNTATSEIWFTSLPDDPRFWFADDTTHDIMESICIPNEMPMGMYEILLHLPDPMPNLYALPEYSIRLANLLPDNNDVWESLTGYNKLGHVISIDNTTSTSVCNGEITLNRLSSLLPVELIEFNALPNYENIIVKWTTSSEYNNDGFNLERSTNGWDFSKIAWEKSKGNSSEKTNYSFTDSNVENNVNYYYRLIQRDVDGTLSHSEIRTAKIIYDEINYADLIRIYPNPTQSSVTIEWSDDVLSTTRNITILNVLGATVQPPFIDDNTIDISQLPTGVYFIQFTINDKNIIKKILKN